MNKCKEKIKVVKNNFIEELLISREPHSISAQEMKLINDFCHYIIENLTEEKE